MSVTGESKISRLFTLPFTQHFNDEMSKRETLFRGRGIDRIPYSTVCILGAAKHEEEHWNNNEERTSRNMEDSRQ
jgi:hypothetical protein